MIFNLKEKCLESPKKEYFYGNIINKSIQNIYLGLAYLEPIEMKKFTPGKGHEEIIYLIEGNLTVNMNNEDFQLKEGESIYIPSDCVITITNPTNKRIYFVIAGGHTESHAH